MTRSAPALRGTPILPSAKACLYHQIQDHYDAARIFVNTSDWEGWPNSFIQAGLGRAALLSLDVNPDSLFQKYALGAFAAGNFDSFKASARAMISDSGALAAMQRNAPALWMKCTTT